MKTGTVVKEVVRNAARPGAVHSAGMKGNGLAKPVGKMPSPASAGKASGGRPEVAMPPEPAKAKKVKMVRGSLAIPQPEYDLLGEMKLRAARLSAPIKKKMLIRASIVALSALPDTAFLRAVRAFSSRKARPSDKAG